MRLPSSWDGGMTLTFIVPCINPTITVQVENLFHLACVVKQQQAEIENDEQTGLPRVYVSEEQKKQDDDDFQEVRHCVIVVCSHHS